MGNSLRPSLASILILAAAALPAAAQTRPLVRRTVPAGDWMATAPQTSSVVLQVDRDTTRGDRGANAQVAAAICRSTAIVDPSLQAVLGIPPAEARGAVSVEAQPTSDAFLTLVVTINDPEKKLPADAGTKIVAEIARRATAAFAQSAELQLAPLKSRRSELEKRIDDAQKQADALDDQYAKVAPAFDAMNGAARYGSSRAELERQRASIVAQLAGLRARLAAVEEATKAASRPGADPVPDGPVPTSMPVDYAIELVKLREKRLASIKQDDPAAMSDAYADLAEAQLMAKLVSIISPNLVRPAAYPSSSSAATLRAQIFEYEGQLTSIEAQLAALGPATTQPAMSQNDFNQLQNDRNEARSRLRQARSELDQFDRQNGPIRAATIVPLTGER